MKGAPRQHQPREPQRPEATGRAADDAARDTISVVATSIPPVARYPDFQRELASKIYSRLRAEGVRESDINIGITRDRNGISPEIVIRILPYAKPPYFSFGSSENGKQTGTVISFACDPKFIDIIWAETSKQAKIFEKKIHGESKKLGYTKKPSPSEADDASQLRMGKDFDIKVKEAKAENLARGKPRSRPATLQLATYRALVKNVDLFNPKLPEAERLTRARRLLGAYDRLRDVRPNFRDSNAQLTEARRIKQAAHRQRQNEMRQGPPPRRGRPPKVANG